MLALLPPMAARPRKPRTPTPCRRSSVGEQARVATLRKKSGQPILSNPLRLLLRGPPRSLRTLPVRGGPVLRHNPGDSRTLLGHQTSNREALLGRQKASSRVLLGPPQMTNRRVVPPRPRMINRCKALLGAQMINRGAPPKRRVTNRKVHPTTQEKGINKKPPLLLLLLLRPPKVVLISSKLPHRSPVLQPERVSASFANNLEMAERYGLASSSLGRRRGRHRGRAEGSSYGKPESRFIYLGGGGPSGLSPLSGSSSGLVGISLVGASSGLLVADGAVPVLGGTSSVLEATGLGASP